VCNHLSNDAPEISRGAEIYQVNNQSKFKIAVIGIGGVGGYIGGKLAAHFENSADVEIGLIARGENEKAIKSKGLKLITTDGEQIVRPNLMTVSEIGNADLILLCTKEYDLEETVSALKDSVGEQTAILPLLNGVDAAERIAKILPETEIWQGCIYIVSKLAAPGVIEKTGDVCLINFGSENGENEKLRHLENIFREAGVNARLVEDISAAIWEKFVFLSSIATATSYLDVPFGALLSNAENKNLLLELAAEITRLAEAKNINVSETAIHQKIGALKDLPYEATTSMLRDYAQGKNAEIESLVGYVVKEARKLNVPVPNYERLYAELTNNQNRQKEVSGHQ
jgi:2-dehydropantoate 2-reductase